MKKIPGCMLISAAVVGCVLVSGCETSDYTDNVTTGCVDETGEIAETDYNISIYDSFETDIFIDMEENNEDVADWRTTGIIIDYGIITRNGKSVDVVVTLFISLSMRIASLKRSVSSSSVSPQIVSSSLVSISFIGNATLLIVLYHTNL